MLKPAEAPTGLSMKFMPIAMIATGTTSVHQNSSEFLLHIELPPLTLTVVFMIGCSSLASYATQIPGAAIFWNKCGDATAEGG